MLDWDIHTLFFEGYGVHRDLRSFPTRHSSDLSTTVIATIRMVAITGDTAASSFRMMLFMVLSSCGLRRHLGTGEPTQIGRASCRERVENSVVAVSLKKKERKEKGVEGRGL